MRVPHNEEYKDAVNSSIRRCTAVMLDEKGLIYRRDYQIGGKRFIVHSIFNLNSKPAEDGIKRLIQTAKN